MKKIISICVVVVAFATVIGFATGAIQETAKDLFQKPQQELLAADVERKAQIDARLGERQTMSKFDQMLAALDATVENPVDYNNVVYNFEYLRQAYHFSQEQLDYLSDLILKGYDPMDVLDICYFWMDTTEDISIIEEIYLQKDEKETQNWIESAFNEVTDDKCGVLTEEDVDTYIGQGLSVQDISLANKLCRRGELTIQEILEKRLEGVSFAELSAEVHKEETEELPEKIRQQSNDRKAKIANQRRQRDTMTEPPELPEEDLIDHQTVVMARKMAKMKQTKPKEYYQKAMDGESVEELLKHTEDEMDDKVDAVLREKGLKKQVTAAEWEAYMEKEGYNE